jgi:UDP-3-O-[3-hydroxymyristoyl] glucosamine N-acyltransferase
MYSLRLMPAGKGVGGGLAVGEGVAVDGGVGLGEGVDIGWFTVPGEGG